MRTLSPTLRRNIRRRIAQEESQPGDVSPPLKRRMRDDDVVEMFEDAGRSLFKKVVEQLKDVLRDGFNEAIPELDQNLKEEGGRRWQKAAAEFYRPWINDMVETIVTQGMNEAAGALEDVASSFAAEQSAPDDEEEDEGDELIEVPVEETEDVEEAEDVEPAEDAEEEGDELDLELEELLAADTLPRTITRPKRHHRRVQADERGLPELKEYRRPTKDPSVEEAPPPFVEAVLNSVLDRLPDEYAEQVTSRKVGLLDQDEGSWGILTGGDVWRVDVQFFDYDGAFDIVTVVHGPQEKFSENWNFDDDVTTGEIGEAVATWLNTHLDRVHGGRRVGSRPFELETPGIDDGVGAQDLAYESAGWIRNVAGMIVGQVEGVHGEQFWINIKSPAGYGTERQTAQEAAKSSLEKIGASFDQTVREEGLTYEVYKMPADLPSVLYATVAEVESDDPLTQVSLTFYEEDMLCIYEPC